MIFLLWIFPIMTEPIFCTQYPINCVFSKGIDTSVLLIVQLDINAREIDIIGINYTLGKGNIRVFRYSGIDWVNPDRAAAW